MSAAVRIIAPRMSPDASGCRAIASTAWPPMRPMPSPTPITARPSPRPAPSSALAFLAAAARSEEHTSELQSRLHLVCRLLLEKKNKDETVVQVLVPALGEGIDG